MNTGKRIKHTNPWRGCQSCKQKQVRCDEIRPVCSNCIKYRRVCYYAPLPYTKPLPLRPQIPHVNHALTDSRHLSASQAYTSPPSNHTFANGNTLASASIPPSLDPYPQSLLPLTPANKALLAFCKSLISPTT